MKKLSKVPIKIGARGSPLAKLQALIVKEKLLSLHDLPQDSIEIIPIKTLGDKIPGSLEKFGGKEAFVKDIEKVLVLEKIDIAVHSVKDTSTKFHDDLCMDVFLPRGDVRDVFLSVKYKSLEDMPAKSTIGTASPRRKAQVLHKNPNLEVVLLRGNIQTRIDKLKNGYVDATFLSLCALQRLGIDNIPSVIMNAQEMIPAVGQGAIGLQIRKNSAEISELIEPLNCETTKICVTCERAFLDHLDGNCSVPIAGLAIIKDDTLSFRGEILSLNGQRKWSCEITGLTINADKLGRDAAKELLSNIKSSSKDAEGKCW